MRVQVSAGFCEIIPDSLASLCRQVAAGPRTGLAIEDDHAIIAHLVADVRRNFLESTWVIAGWDWRRADGTLYQQRDANLTPYTAHLANQCESLISEWRKSGGADRDLIIEIGNELDGSYWKNRIDEYYELAMACYRRVRSLSGEVIFITGSTMNFNKEPLWKRGGYEVLRDLTHHSWPTDTVQGLHPYRGGGRYWPSFDNEDAALEKLRRMLNGRSLAITEMGWESYRGHSDETIADMTRAECEMWREFGAILFVWYQIQDAPRPDNTDKDGGFGAFTNLVDGGDAKPVVSALAHQLTKEG